MKRGYNIFNGIQPSGLGEYIFFEYSFKANFHYGLFYLIYVIKNMGYLMSIMVMFLIT